VGQSALKWC